MSFEYKDEYKYPSNVCLNITDNCNLACRYCFVHQHPHYMSLKTAKQAVDYVMNNWKYKKENFVNFDDSASITFFGGEPTLLWDEIIVPTILYGQEKYGTKNLSFDITTNGTLLTEERLKFLADHQVTILLSIDGIKEVQDKNRPCRNGQSSFDLIEPNIPFILQYLPNTTFRMTLHQDTCSHLFDSYLFAIKLGFQNIFFCPNAREKWTIENLQILKEEINKIYLFILGDFLENNSLRINSSQIDKSFKQILLNDLQVYYNEYNILNPHRNKIRCGLGTTSVSIAYDGKLYACQEQDSNGSDNFFYMGDIYNGINKEKHITILTLYDQDKMMMSENEELCTSCILRTNCIDDFCPSVSYDLFKNFFIKPEVDCLLNQWMTENAIFLMKVLTEENNNRFQTYLSDIFFPYIKNEKKEKII